MSGDDPKLYRLSVTSRVSYDEMKDLIGDVLDRRKKLLSVVEGDEDEGNLSNGQVSLFYPGISSLPHIEEDDEDDDGDEVVAEVVEKPRYKEGGIIGVWTNISDDLIDRLSDITGVKGVTGMPEKVSEEEIKRYIDDDFTDCIDVNDLIDELEGEEVEFEGPLGRDIGVVDGFDKETNSVIIKLETDEGLVFRDKKDIEKVFPDIADDICL